MSDFSKKSRDFRSKKGRSTGGSYRPQGARPRKQNEERYELRIEKMVQGGEGMARLPDGRVCFVQGALPGELCEVRLTFQKKDFTRGRAVEILEASPDRVKPRCPLYGKCGGCSLQHLASDKQAEYLERIERENFKRLAHAELPADFFIHVGEPWGYRNRARVVYCKGRPGKTGGRFAFREQESNELIPFENCPVLTPALNEFLQGTARNIFENKVEKDSESETGNAVEKSAQNNLYKKDYAPRPRTSNAHGEAPSLNVFDNGSGKVSFFYRGMPASQFREHAVSVVEIGGTKIESDASVFFQSNLGLLPELVESVRKAVDEGLASGEASNEWLIDLFSGVGFFAALLQDKFKRVTTVERDEGCLKHAEVNLSKINASASAKAAASNAAASTNAVASNAAASCAADTSLETNACVSNVSAPAEEWLLQNVVDLPATLIVDPPRTGLPKEALDAIVKSSVNRLIYVSCDPVTLARDYAKFASAGFSLKHAEGFAFYPQTPHLEMLFILSR